MIQTDVAIVGAGIAGLTAAATITSEFPTVRTLMINGEDRWPYKRTKLSKHIASGYSRNQFQIESAQWFEQNGIEILNGTKVTRIAPDSKELELADGRTVGWHSLILATGAAADRPVIPGIDDIRFFMVRNAADGEALMAAAAHADNVMIVGTGVLGTEIAEQMCRLGKKIIFSGHSHGVMTKELNDYAQNQLRDAFESNGVELRLNHNVLGLQKKGKDRITVSTSDFSRTVDMIVFCIGSKADTRLAADAGIEVRNGILVDDTLETSSAGVFAAGDVAEHPGGEVTHLWHAAERQGAYAGRNAAQIDTGAKAAYPGPPFRMKCEVFDRYFFSLLPYSSEAAGGSLQKTEYRDSRYICLYTDGELLHGVVMIDDRENAKRYEAAVRERWTIKKVESELIGKAKLISS